MRNAFRRVLQCAALLCGVAALFAPAHAQKTYTYTFPAPTTVVQYDGTTQAAGSSPVFDRPIPNGYSAPIGISSVGTAVSYATKNIVISADGNYDIRSDTVTPANWDNQIFIYRGSFDPNNPLTNCVAGDTAGYGVGHSGFSAIPLMSGIYVLVTTASSNGVVGSFNNTVAVSSVSGSPVASFTSTTAPAGGSPAFNRPNASGTGAPAALSAIGTNVYYQTQSFTISVAGTYQVSATCASPDGWGIAAYLYKTTFDPAHPLTNCIAGDNPAANAASATLSNLTLAAGTTYVVVTTSYNNGTTGTFNATVNPLINFDSYSGTTLGQPAFNRPIPNGNNKPTQLSMTATAVRYSAHSFMAPSSGAFTFISNCTTPSNWDNLVVLYQTTFDNTKPLLNCLIASDGATSSSAGFTYNLSSGATYVLVTTGFLNSYAGAFTNIINPASGGTPGTALLTYSGTLSGGAALRFNRPDANGSSAPVAVSATATSVAYHADSFTVPTTGRYNLLSVCANLSGWDNYTLLYQDGFDPAHPLTNCLLGNDNLSDKNHSGMKDVLLTAGVTYYFVTTGADTPNFGAYTATVSPSTGYALQLNYSDATSLGTAQTFVRPNTNGDQPPTSLSTADADHYQSYAFTANASGNYNFYSNCTDPAAWDNILLLYQDSFDPAKPLKNCLIVVDGDTTDSALLSYRLTAGTGYILVTTGYGNTNFGAFHNKVTRGFAVFPPPIPDNDPAGLSAAVSVPDSIVRYSLERVTITGLNHPFAGDLLATLTHEGTTIELFDRLGATPTNLNGSGADFQGNYVFRPSPTGKDLLAAANKAAAASKPIPTNQFYAPFLNGTSAQSGTSVSTFAEFVNINPGGTWTLNIADHASTLNGSYTGFSLVFVPIAATVSGTVTLQSLSPSALFQDVTFTFRPADNSGDIVRVASIGPDGTFSLAGIPQQAYTLHIKGAKWLAVNTPIDLSGGDLSNVNVTLPAGDGDNDNHVDTADFALMVNAYGFAYDPDDVTTPDYLIMADFDCDGLIDGQDFSLLVNSYGLDGDL